MLVNPTVSMAVTPNATAHLNGDLNPRFSLPDTTPRSSKTTLVIGGIQLYVYGLDELRYPNGLDGRIAVLHLAHMRTRTYAVTEAMAHEILHRCRSLDQSSRRMEVIAVTMDMRNHGSREVDAQANRTWKEGNEQHALDLLSVISGSQHDFQLVLDYLPAYLPQFSRISNIVMGISLGAHMAYRLASTIPTNQVLGYVIVVGCPDLTKLLHERLGVVEDRPGQGKLANGSGTCPMTEQQRRRYPQALADVVRNQDEVVFNSFPSSTPTFVCCGALDPLVPPKHSLAWLKRREEVGRGLRQARVFVQDNTAHSCTKEMVGLISEWIDALLVIENAH